MNPMVQVQLNRLQHNLRTLAAKQDELRNDLMAEKQTSESRLKLLWRHEQARTTLDLNAHAYSELQERLAQSEELNRQVVQHAANIAQWSAALADTLSE